MKSLPLALVLTISIPLITAAPAVAQDPPAPEQQCRSALERAERLLVNGRRLRVSNVSTYRIGEHYLNYPRQAPVGLSISMAGDAAPDMMSSPQLLMSITMTITSGCTRVGLVDFSVAETDWVTTFGLVNNQSREFECVDPDGTNNPTQWGSRTCI